MIQLGLLFISTVYLLKTGLPESRNSLKNGLLSQSERGPIFRGSTVLSIQIKSSLITKWFKIWRSALLKLNEPKLLPNIQNFLWRKSHKINLNPMPLKCRMGKFFNNSQWTRYSSLQFLCVNYFVLFILRRVNGQFSVKLGRENGLCAELVTRRSGFKSKLSKNGV